MADERKHKHLELIQGVINPFDEFVSVEGLERRSGFRLICAGGG